MNKLGRIIMKYVVIKLLIGEPLGNTYFYLSTFQMLSMKMYCFVMKDILANPEIIRAELKFYNGRDFC